MKNVFCSVFATIGVLLSPGLLAQNVVLEGSVGIAEPQSGPYESSLLMDGSVSYSSSGWLYRIGFTAFDAFKSDSRSNPIEIETSGVYLQAIKVVTLEPFDIEIGAGLYRTHSEAFMEKSPYNASQRKIGSAYDTNPVVTVALVKNMAKSFSLLGGFKYINDVSGSDLHMIYAGGRFNF